jgi:hypothetical protein
VNRTSSACARPRSATQTGRSSQLATLVRRLNAIDNLGHTGARRPSAVGLGRANAAVSP